MSLFVLCFFSWMRSNNPLLMNILVTNFVNEIIEQNKQGFCHFTSTRHTCLRAVGLRDEAL